MQELDEKNKKRYKIIRAIIQAILIIAVLAVIVFITIKLYPFFANLAKDDTAREQFIADIRSYGWLSFFIVLGLQVFQTIFMVIPAGPIVMASGVLFNPALAIIICLAGQTIGSIIVYYLIKILGYRFVALFIDPDKIKNSKLLGNVTRTKVLMFGYLLIPALPKDIVSFVAPFTNIKIKDFIWITLIARIPMTIVTVLMGSSLINGAYGITIALAVISFVLAMVCFIFNNKIVQYLEKKSTREEMKNETK